MDRLEVTCAPKPAIAAVFLVRLEPSQVPADCHLLTTRQEAVSAQSASRLSQVRLGSASTLGARERLSFLVACTRAFAFFVRRALLEIAVAK